MTRFLDSRHAGRYKIYNLYVPVKTQAEKRHSQDDRDDRCSERSYDTRKFHDQGKHARGKADDDICSHNCWTLVHQSMDASIYRFILWEFITLWAESSIIL